MPHWMQSGDCPNAREPLPPIAKLDPTVALQVLRSGGLKGENKIDPKEVDGRIAQLRSQMKEDQAAKTQPKGKANRRASQRQVGRSDYSGRQTACAHTCIYTVSRSHCSSENTL